MSARTVRSVNEAFSHAFPERRIYIRSDARTRFLTFTPVSQCAMACVLAACIGWAGFTSYTFIDRATDGRTAERRLEAAHEAYEIQLAALREQQRLLEEELNRSNARGDAVTLELSKKQRVLVETATKYQAADAELEGLRTEFENLVSLRRGELAQLERLNEQVVGLRLALAEAERRTVAMDDTLAIFSRSMADVIAARDSATERARTLDEHVASLQDEIGKWETRQENLLARLESATSASIDALDALFADAEIDLDDVLDQTRRDFTGRGGTYTPIIDDRRSAADLAGEERVAALMGDIERVSLMRVAVDRLPFGMPTRGAELTSDFGPRRDPFRRRPAMHEGVDFAAPSGTPIYATAEGVVTFSGRQGGYGNIVKIRHAFGFETAYAHLSKSRVRVGQRVARGAQIADMGSTGRSTGSHLHYEVRIDGKPVNPHTFIKAARDVL